MKDLTGKRFGKLVVLYRNGQSLDRHSVIWACQCDCGKVCSKPARNLGRTKWTSCGCIDGHTQRRNASNKSAICNAHDGIRRNAKLRGYSFSISRSQFESLASQACSYCGNPPSNVSRWKGQEYKYNGLDRVDNSKGYTMDNVVPCCKRCNVAKNDQTRDGFLSWVRSIYERI